MKPRPLHDRSALVDLVRQHAPTRACQRAIDEDRTFVLGGFSPPEGLPYWLVQITGRHGSVWYVGIRCNEPANKFEPFWPEAPEWEHWDGSIQGRSLKDGDKPRLFARWRAKARRQRNGTT